MTQDIMVKVVVFVLASLALAYVSRASILVPRSHGFYRFFAWEAILGQALLNVGIWFRDPLSWHQIISWVLLMVSLCLVIEGVRLLKGKGRPDTERNEPPLISFEKTTRLVSVGVYRYIRHPMYSSLLFLAWGIFFKGPSWIGAVLAAAATLFLVITARIEEDEDKRFFGPKYEEYMIQTKMFIPYLF
ncbi:methyltransferase family protein [Chloroflexota bacterium]